MKEGGGGWGWKGRLDSWRGGGGSGKFWREEARGKERGRSLQGPKKRTRRKESFEMDRSCGRERGEFGGGGSELSWQ